MLRCSPKDKLLSMVLSTGQFLSPFQRRFPVVNSLTLLASRHQNLGFQRYIQSRHNNSQSWLHLQEVQSHRRTQLQTTVSQRQKCHHTRPAPAPTLKTSLLASSTSLRESMSRIHLLLRKCSRCPCLCSGGAASRWSCSPRLSRFAARRRALV